MKMRKTLICGLLAFGWVLSGLGGSSPAHAQDRRLPVAALETRVSVLESEVEVLRKKIQQLEGGTVGTRLPVAPSQTVVVTRTVTTPGVVASRPFSPAGTTRVTSVPTAADRSISSWVQDPLTGVITTSARTQTVTQSGGISYQLGGGGCSNGQCGAVQQQRRGFGIFR